MSEQVGKNSTQSPEQNPFPEYGLTQNEKLMLELYKDCLGELDQLCTPEEAQKKLEHVGYDASLWEQIVRDKIGSHEIRTFAIIALGNHSRLGYVIVANLRAIDHFDGWPPMGNAIGIAPTINDETVHTEALKQAMARYTSEQDI